MEQEKNNLSIMDIKQYLRLMIHDPEEFSTLEFLTIKEWLLYSFSLVAVLCVPCAGILFITGLLSGGISWGLLIATSLIPFMFITPLTLLLTYINNYRKPKVLRKYILQGLKQYQWDSPVKKVGRTSFEGTRNGYFFRIEARHFKEKEHKGWFIAMIVPFYMPRSVKDKDKYIADVFGYLKGRSFFVLHHNMAFNLLPAKLFPKLDLSKSIDELLYAMRRFNLRTNTFYSPTAIIDQIPDTLEILAMTMFDSTIDEKWTEWSNKMLKAGFINDHMRDFASLTPCAENQEDLRARMYTLIYEFNLGLSKENTLINYIQYLIFLNESGEKTILEVTQSLRQLYLDSGIPALRDFNSLYNVKTGIDILGIPDSPEWDTIRSEGVDKYIINHLSLLIKTGFPALSEKDQ